jgi:hypothetical protein
MVSTGSHRLKLAQIQRRSTSVKVSNTLNLQQIF